MMQQQDILFSAQSVLGNLLNILLDFLRPCRHEYDLETRWGCVEGEFKPYFFHF